jgi:hypothetical protein
MFALQRGDLVKNAPEIMADILLTKDPLMKRLVDRAVVIAQ